jgi:Beta-lactamase superfamily domain
MSQDEELVFVALGGLGEIGMNSALYGFGPARRRQWLMVDLGVAFAGDDLPGVDLILPDIAFIEKVKRDLVGIVITHAHEDHIGALIDLWPRLGVRVYATRFAAGLLEARRLSEPGAPDIPIEIVEQGGRVSIGPFDVEFISVAHSIPESCALAIRTPAGLVVHTGDWKIDATPLVGAPTDEGRLKALGEEGVLALICDSTNVLREGESPSEADVAKSLAARRRHLLRLECRALAGGGGGRLRQWPPGAGDGPRDGAGHRGRPRMRLSQRRAGFSRHGSFRSPAARQSARAGDRKPRRAARGHGAHRRGRASRRLARAGRSGDLFVARHSRQ